MTWPRRESFPPGGCCSVTAGLYISVFLGLAGALPVDNSQLRGSRELLLVYAHVAIVAANDVANRKCDISTENLVGTRAQLRATGVASAADAAHRPLLLKGGSGCIQM